MTKKDFMKLAIDLSIENIDKGGGPFGAVIVKDNKVIAASGNSVTNDLDPTAHAEVNAIRKAAKVLGNFDLSGCEIYASCEPCPMCLGAIYWARIDKLYFANTKVDADKIGFSDKFIYDEFEKKVSERDLKTENFMREEALEAFRKWENSQTKTEY
ncbi:MAG TPA: nucleoside deaminase [Bacteroidales bacterium]|jgi:tRNA(Arg) A34 adenosine deaminase TadA|nr:nucleoside deaminase [Bacteroidales bacterium]HOE38895.1 nucleoside deaminase [Bacteroidales bacterium]HPL05234.1 nucleoside deaminase [Bacteroidales bacterium]HPX76045.1 nucleoside deaminase [Bacteroidales bacterium]HQB22401.1 nucleoside deaminase [Bacteroidales bacterium]